MYRLLPHKTVALITAFWPISRHFLLNGFNLARWSALLIARNYTVGDPVLSWGVRFLAQNIWWPFLVVTLQMHIRFKLYSSKPVSTTPTSFSCYSTDDSPHQIQPLPTRIASKKFFVSEGGSSVCIHNPTNPPWIRPLNYLHVVKYYEVILPKRSLNRPTEPNTFLRSQEPRTGQFSGTPTPGYLETHSCVARTVPNLGRRGAIISA